MSSSQQVYSDLIWNLFLLEQIRILSFVQSCGNSRSTLGASPLPDPELHLRSERRQVPMTEQEGAQQKHFVWFMKVSWLSIKRVCPWSQWLSGLEKYLVSKTRTACLYKVLCCVLPFSGQEEQQALRARAHVLHPNLHRRPDDGGWSGTAAPVRKHTFSVTRSSSASCTESLSTCPAACDQTKLYSMQSAQRHPVLFVFIPVLKEKRSQRPNNIWPQSSSEGSFDSKSKGYAARRHESICSI